MKFVKDLNKYFIIILSQVNSILCQNHFFFFLKKMKSLIIILYLKLYIKKYYWWKCSKLILTCWLLKSIYDMWFQYSYINIINFLKNSWYLATASKSNPSTYEPITFASVPYNFWCNDQDQMLLPGKYNSNVGVPTPLIESPE